MKKIVLLFVFVFLHAANVEYYLYSVDMNYKEYDTNGAYLDGESSHFGELNGIGIKYTSKESLWFYLKGEYAYGSTTYNGATWGGTPVVLNKKDVYLLNFEGGIYPYRNPYYIALGYRYWNRGKSDYPGDYDEQYYWPYLGFGYSYIFKIHKLFLTADFAYQYAINPKLDTHLGSGTTLDLGPTEGLKFELKGLINYENNIMFTFFYRYQYWNIDRSAPSSIELNGNTVYIVEPESVTRNQYLGVGLLYKF